MKTLLRTSMLVTLVGGLALAETYTGKLIDNTCAARDKNAACAPTQSTTSFAPRVSGKAVPFDTAGNAKAADAWKQSNAGANRSQDPNAMSSDVTATVTGTMSGDQIKVDTIQVRWAG